METQLEDVLSCCICLKKLSSPKALPCQHTFCKKPCLKKIIKDKKAICPMCRQVYTEPQDGFPTNFLIQTLLDLSLTKEPPLPSAPSETLFDEVEKVAKCATKESVSITRDYDEMLNSYLAQSFKMTNDYNHIISYETIDD